MRAAEEKQNRRPFFIGVMFALGLSGASHAGPINSNSAFAPHRGESIVRLQSRSLQANRDSSPMDRKLQVGGVTAVYVYGFTERTSGTLVVPYLDKSLRLTPSMGPRVTRRTDGLADIRTLLKYRVYTKDKPGMTHRLGLFGGIEWPTGDDDDRDALGRLPQTLQLGSGSWDPIVGAVWTTQTLGWEFDADLGYKVNTKANNFEFGDQIFTNISYQHRLRPKELPDEGVPSFIYGVMELNANYAEKNELGGIVDDDSGGLSVFLSPGLQWVTASWVVEGSIQIPIVQDLHGDPLKTNYATTLGARYRF